MSGTAPFLLLIKPVHILSVCDDKTFYLQLVVWRPHVSHLRETWGLHTTKGETRMNHHRLKAYCVLLEVAKRVPSLTRTLPRGEGYLVDQFKRALSSAILNLSEGNGRIYAKERCRFFNISTASIAECMSCLDILLSFGYISEVLHSELCGNFKLSYAMIRKLASIQAHPPSAF